MVHQSLMRLEEEKDTEEMGQRNPLSVITVHPTGFATCCKNCFRLIVKVSGVGWSGAKEEGRGNIEMGIVKVLFDREFVIFELRDSILWSLRRHIK